MDDQAARDLACLKQVRRGDPAGGAALFERWSTPLFRFAHRMLGDAAEAEEVAQEVFLKMISRVEQYDGRASVSTWLFSIAANACRDRLRKSGRHVPLDDSHDRPAAGPGALARLIERESRERVRRALGKLTEEQREALVLARYEGMKYHEIARVLGTSENAVKTRIFRAMAVLREHFSEGAAG